MDMSYEAGNTLSTGCATHLSKVPDHPPKVPPHPLKVPAKRVFSAKVIKILSIDFMTYM